MVEALNSSPIEPRYARAELARISNCTISIEAFNNRIEKLQEELVLCVEAKKRLTKALEVTHSDALQRQA